MSEFITDAAALNKAAEIVDQWSAEGDAPWPWVVATADLLRAIAGYYDPYSWPCMWMSQSEAECPHCAAVSLAGLVLGDK